jgi:hypothetical protein
MRSSYTRNPIVPPPFQIETREVAAAAILVRVMGLE